MPNIIVPSGTTTINIPTGLSATIKNVDAHNDSSVELVYNSGTLCTLSGSNNDLDIIVHGPFDAIVTNGAYANIYISYYGNQEDFKLFDANKRLTNGHYPGSWGTGIGSK